MGWPVSFIDGDSRDQISLLPAYVAPDALVRVVDAFVASLDLAELGFNRVAAAITGRPGYQPGDMLPLYVWGYLNQVRSSRHLERACVRDLEALWLMRRLTPDYRTIAAFRHDNPEAIIAASIGKRSRLPPANSKAPLKIQELAIIVPPARPAFRSPPEARGEARRNARAGCDQARALIESILVGLRYRTIGHTRQCVPATDCSRIRQTPIVWKPANGLGCDLCATAPRNSGGVSRSVTTAFPATPLRKVSPIASSISSGWLPLPRGSDGCWIALCPAQPSNNLSRCRYTVSGWSACLPPPPSTIWSVRAA